MQIIDVNTGNFREVLSESVNLPVLFYFYSAQVPECQDSDVMVNQLVQKYPELFLLAKVNCDEEQAIAMQFRLQAIPTFYLFKDGQPVDGLQGPQRPELLDQLLLKVLPSPAEQKLVAAKNLIAESLFAEAFPLLKEAFTEVDSRAPYHAEIVLSFAEVQIQLNRVDDVETTLESLLPQDRDSRYQGLLAQIEIARKAADSPEIQSLQKQVEAEPDNFALLIQLALQLHQVGRNEEALTSLFEVLRKDMSVADGEVKKAFMDILAALGTGDNLASKFRKQLYSLLY